MNAGTKRAIPMFILALSACISGCGDHDTLDPPTLQLGQDVCIACGMIVSDERFASAVVFRHDGRIEKHAFDDVGEMLETDLSKHRPGEIADVRWYVKDASTLEWIEAPKAHYIKSKDLHTPMGFGVAAYVRLDDAKNAAERTNGQVRTYEELRID